MTTSENKEIPMRYRAIGQTQGLTITAEIEKDVLQSIAIADAEKHVFPPSQQGNLRPFVVLPICTDAQWRSGHVNFCPRCGKRIAEDPRETSHVLDGNCPECEAYLNVYIQVREEHDESEAD